MNITEQDAKTCKLCNLMFNKKYEFFNHIKKEHRISYENYIIKVYYNGNRPLCKCGCGTGLSFKAFANGNWFSEYTTNHFPHKKHTLKNKQYIKRRVVEQTLKKYGVTNVWKLDSVKKKIKQTKLKRYGDANYNNSFKNKIHQLKSFYSKLFNSNRLKDKYLPLFSLDEYDGVKSKKYPFKCLTCNNKFFGDLNNGLIPRCFKCYPINLYTSTAQHEIANFIKTINSNLTVIENDRTILKNMELDIYIPQKSIAIEYDGLYWHSEITGKKDKLYHLTKTNRCNDINIRLIHIFEDEWVYKQDIVKSRLKYILGNNSNDSVYARDCIIKEISTSEKNDFLFENHIQGKDKSLIKLGCYYKDKIIGVMTFGNNRISLGNKSQIDEYELIRYATSRNLIGGASKLLSYFIKTYHPKKITSYSDLRWNTGKLYEKLGFDLIVKTKPNYWYVPKNKLIRVHRFNYRKNVLRNLLSKFDKNLTEWQNMQLNGFDRIWDCGNLKYELFKK